MIWGKYFLRIERDREIAVSVEVPSTSPPKYAPISAESPVWYLINILLFNFQKFFNWFSKHV